MFDIVKEKTKASYPVVVDEKKKDVESETRSFFGWKKKTQPREGAIRPEIKKRKHIFTSLIPAEEKEYFIENLSMLLSSGMDILMALDSIKKEVRSSQMKEVIDGLREDVDAGFPIWKVLEETKFFPAFIISLIKIGEKSGGLVKNLKVISVQQKKDRSFTSKVRSAMMYPVFVLTLTVIVGIGIAWFILPRLTVVFDQLKVELPLITRILITFGKFIDKHGSIAVPAFILGLFLVVYFVFIFSRTKFIGQTLLFYFPGIKKLIQETELARMGYVLGTLLQAGIPVTDALKALAEASTFYKYQNLYLFLRESIEDGNTFRQSFDIYPKSKKLVPTTIQQMIMVGEGSGHLAETMISIGETFEEKIDNTTKNLAVILEPVLLVIVWLGVVSVALAVILPIYSLIGGLNKTTDNSSPSTSAIEEVFVDEPSDTQVEIEPVSSVKEKKLEVSENGQGFLNVREKPVVSGKLIKRIKPGEVYVYLEERNGWYQIVLDGGEYTDASGQVIKNQELGWVSGEYVKLVSSW